MFKELVIIIILIVAIAWIAVNAASPLQTLTTDYDSRPALSAVDAALEPKKSRVHFAPTVQQRMYNPETGGVIGPDAIVPM